MGSPSIKSDQTEVSLNWFIGFGLRPMYLFFIKKMLKIINFIKIDLTKYRYLYTITISLDYFYIDIKQSFIRLETTHILSALILLFGC